MPEKKILLMFGPSGAGKSTLLKKLFAEYPDAFGFSVSHTTRKPRPGEVNGKDYHFTEREHMIAAVAEGKFIENAEFSGNMYGTSQQSVKDVLEKGKICVLDIDVQGVELLKKTPLHDQTVYVFIRPPSVEALEARLRGRNTETEESLGKRLSAARREVEYGDQPGNCDYTVVNDDLETAYAELRAIVDPLVKALTQ